MFSLPRPKVFPMAVSYVAFGLFRAGLLGLLDRRQSNTRSGWFPGGVRETDLPTVETVGEEGIGHRRRRRRRRSGHHRPDRDQLPPTNDPTPGP